MLSFSQNDEKEFEGIITYEVSVDLINQAIKKKPLVKNFGKLTRFYFKNGMHKWESEKTIFESEIFNNSIDEFHVIDKNRNSDTLYYTGIGDQGHSVSKILDLPNETICGVLCKATMFIIVDDDDNLVVKRTIYYPIDSFKYDEEYYTNYTDHGQDDISKYCGSIPLRLVMEFPNNSFKVTYNAIDIEWIELSDDVFSIDRKAPVVKEK